MKYCVEIKQCFSLINHRNNKIKHYIDSSDWFFFYVYCDIVCIYVYKIIACAVLLTKILFECIKIMQALLFLFYLQENF